MFANMALALGGGDGGGAADLQILSYEFVADRAGAGKFRGGVPFRRDYRFLEADEAMFQRARRPPARFSPYGLYGGSPGAAV